PSKGDACSNVRVMVWIAALLPHVHRRVDCAGADGIHPDALFGMVKGGGPGQSNDAMLAGDIGRVSPGATQPHDRGIVYDCASTDSQQLRDLVFHTEEDAFEIGVEYAIPKLLGAPGKWAVLLVNACIIEGVV